MNIKLSLAICFLVILNVHANDKYYINRNYELLDFNKMFGIEHECPAEQSTHVKLTGTANIKTHILYDRGQNYEEQPYSKKDQWLEQNDVETTLILSPAEIKHFDIFTKLDDDILPGDGDYSLIDNLNFVLNQMDEDKYFIHNQTKVRGNSVISIGNSKAETACPHGQTVDKTNYKLIFDNKLSTAFFKIKTESDGHHRDEKWHTLKDTDIKITNISVELFCEELNFPY